MPLSMHLRSNRGAWVESPALNSLKCLEKIQMEAWVLMAKRSEKKLGIVCKWGQKVRHSGMGPMETKSRMEERAVKWEPYFVVQQSWWWKRWKEELFSHESQEVTAEDTNWKGRENSVWICSSFKLWDWTEGCQKRIMQVQPTYQQWLDQCFVCMQPRQNHCCTAISKVCQKVNTTTNNALHSKQLIQKWFWFCFQFEWLVIFHSWSHKCFNKQCHAFSILCCKRCFFEENWIFCTIAVLIFSWLWQHKLQFWAQNVGRSTLWIWQNKKAGLTKMVHKKVKWIELLQSAAAFICPWQCNGCFKQWVQLFVYIFNVSGWNMWVLSAFVLHTNESLQHTPIWFTKCVQFEMAVSGSIIIEVCRHLLCHFKSGNNRNFLSNQCTMHAQAM